MTIQTCTKECGLYNQLDYETRSGTIELSAGTHTILFEELGESFGFRTIDYILMLQGDSSLGLVLISKQSNGFTVTLGIAGTFDYFARTNKLFKI